MASPSTTSVPTGRVPVKVKLEGATLKKIIEADSFIDKGGDDTARRLYEYNCNARELEVYNLLKKMVHDLNEGLKVRQERVRLIDEGDGLYVELD